MSDVASIVLAFVSGGTIGALVSTFLTTRHERTERFRERMLASAEELLAAEERWLRRVHELGHTGSRLVELRAELQESDSRLNTVFGQTEEIENDDDSDFDAPENLTIVLGQLLDFFEEGMDDERLKTLTSEVAEVRRELLRLEVPEQQPLSDALRYVLKVFSETGLTLAAFTRANRELIDARIELSHRVPRVNILFGGRDMSVVEAAANLTNAARSLDEAVFDAMRRWQDIYEDKAVESANDNLTDALFRFSDEVNSRIRKRRL